MKKINNPKLVTKSSSQLTINADKKNAGYTLYIVINAGSGDKNATLVASELAKFFNDASQPHKFFICCRPNDMSAMTKQAIAQAASSKGAVVAAGGDGTIRYIAQEALAADLPFGVLPLGTFNYFARDNEIPQDVIAAAEVLIKSVRVGYERPVQVGLLNDQVFLVNASLGLYPQLLEDREKFKQEHGRSRIMARWAGLISLLKLDIKMLLRIENDAGKHESGKEVVRASTIFVGNNQLQLDDVGLNNEARSVENGQLAIIALSPMTAFQRVLVAFRGLFRLLSNSPNVTHFSCHKLIVEPLSHHRKHFKVATDGEVSKMKSPFVFRVGPQPLRLIMPPSVGLEK